MTPPASDFDPLQPDCGPRPLRPTVLPRFMVRQSIADIGCIALLATAMLEMVAAAIQALTEPAAPIFVGGQIGRLPVQVPPLSISFSDRLATFARAGANVTVALMLLVAIVVATSLNRDESNDHPVGLGKALMLGSGALASVVTLVNAAVCIDLLTNATGVFGGIGQTNRTATMIQFLAPIGLSIAALWCLGTRPQSPIPPRTASESSAA